MKRIHMKRMLIICLAAFLLLNPIHASAALLKKGSSNNEVRQVQKVLKQLGFFQYPKITGFYGTITVKAVKTFQRKNGLAADGIVGSRTRNALKKSIQPEAVKTPASENQIQQADVKVKKEAKNTITAVKDTSRSGALDWYKEVQYIWKKGMNATVTDIKTGKSFQIKRTYGHNHADVEPLTKNDTKIIKNIWNGWSWERRAVTVEVDGRILAASMTAMPHAGVDSAPAGKVVSRRSGNYGRGTNLDAVKGNGASGVMDIHFLNSRTHGSNKVIKSQQDMVKKAKAYISKLSKKNL